MDVAEVMVWEDLAMCLPGPVMDACRLVCPTEMEAAHLAWPVVAEGKVIATDGRALWWIPLETKDGCELKLCSSKIHEALMQHARPVSALALRVHPGLQLADLPLLKEEKCAECAGAGQRPCRECGVPGTCIHCDGTGVVRPEHYTCLQDAAEDGWPEVWVNTWHLLKVVGAMEMLLPGVVVSVWMEQQKPGGPDLSPLWLEPVPALAIPRCGQGRLMPVDVAMAKRVMRTREAGR